MFICKQAHLWISDDPGFNFDSISYVVRIHTIKNRDEVNALNNYCNRSLACILCRNLSVYYCDTVCDSLLQAAKFNQYEWLWIPVRSTCTKHDHNKLILLFIHCIVNWWTDYQNYFEDSFIIIYLQQFRRLFSFSGNDKEEALITVITSHIVLEEERVPRCLENNYYFPSLIFVKEKK